MSRACLTLEVVIVGAGPLIVSLGDAMQLVALLWLSSQAPAAGVAVGAMAFAATGPPVILGPFLGPMVDRANQRFLLLVSHLVRALITLPIPFAYTRYGIWGAFVPVLIQTSLACSST